MGELGRQQSRVNRHKQRQRARVANGAKGAQRIEAKNCFVKALMNMRCKGLVSREA